MSKAFAQFCCVLCAGASLTGFAVAAPASAPGANAHGGVFKRAAVRNPDAVEPSEGTPVADRYELDAASAAAGNPITGGSELDQEIDELLKKVTKPKTAPTPLPVTSPPAAKAPRFGPARKPVHRTEQKPPSEGVAPNEPPTATTPAARMPAVPPANNGPSGQTSSLSTSPAARPAVTSGDSQAQLHDRLFPAPLWRRQAAERNKGQAPAPKLPRGI